MSGVVTVAFVFGNRRLSRWLARVIIGADGSRAMDGFLNQVVTPHALQKQAAPARVRNQ